MEEKPFQVVICWYETGHVCLPNGWRWRRDINREDEKFNYFASHSEAIEFINEIRARMPGYECTLIRDGQHCEGFDALLGNTGSPKPTLVNDPRVATAKNPGTAERVWTVLLALSLVFVIACWTCALILHFVPFARPSNASVLKLSCFTCVWSPLLSFIVWLFRPPYKTSGDAPTTNVTMPRKQS